MGKLTVAIYSSGPFPADRTDVPPGGTCPWSTLAGVYTVDDCTGPCEYPWMEDSPIALTRIDPGLLT